MLEASDDLTNLSHLNEPAGRLYILRRVLVDGVLTEAYSPPSYQTTIFAKRDLHV